MLLDLLRCSWLDCFVLLFPMLLLLLFFEMAKMGAVLAEVISPSASVSRLPADKVDNEAVLVVVIAGPSDWGRWGGGGVMTTEVEAIIDDDGGGGGGGSTFESKDRDL